MSRKPKHNYPELIAEYDQRRASGESHRSIQATFEARGIHWRTFNNQRSAVNRTPTEETMTDEMPVEVLDEHMNIDDADTAPTDAVSVSPIGDIVAVSEASEPLSPDEAQTLDHYEQIIAQGMQTFVEVGHALLAIRDQHLYRQSYQTFEEYLRQRWDLSRPHAYRMIDAAVVVENLSPIGDMVPVNESQARPLTRLPPEQQAEVWREVVETAPPSGITAKHVQETVKRVKTPSMGTKTQTVKPFDVQSITSKIKDLYMDWLKHCETDEALETAQFFLNTLSDLAQGRGMQLQRQ
jgi:hypothetical protein